MGSQGVPRYPTGRDSCHFLYLEPLEKRGCPRPNRLETVTVAPTAPFPPLSGSACAPIVGDGTAAVLGKLSELAGTEDWGRGLGEQRGRGE